MAPKSFNTEQGSVPAIVVSTDDPESRGRVQVQTLAQQDIPPKDLPWTFIHSGEHFPQHFSKEGSIGASPHVLIPGAWVNVNKGSGDDQTSISSGAIATDGTEGEA